MREKRILVTGGTGFIGSNLVKRLLKEGAEVFVLARESSNFGRLNEVLGKVRFRISDLSDAAGLKKIVQEVKPDGVFHLGATTIMSGFIAEQKMIKEVNVLGTKNLLEALSGIDYDFFINTSTFTENADDDYAKSKREAAEFCINYAKKNAKPIVTLRLFTPYGPFIQKGRLIFNVLKKAMIGEDIEMTSPGVSRDFIYIDDLVDLYFTAAECAKENIGEAFNAGSGVKTTLKEVVDSAISITNSQSKVHWGTLPVVSYDSFDIQADISKTISCLGWKPKTSFEEGLKKTYEWLKGNLHLYK